MIKPPDGPLFNAFFRVGIEHNAVDIDAGEVHIIRSDVTQLNDSLDFHNANFACHGHGRVEIAGGQVEAQIA